MKSEPYTNEIELDDKPLDSLTLTFEYERKDNQWSRFHFNRFIPSDYYLVTFTATSEYMLQSDVMSMNLIYPDRQYKGKEIKQSIFNSKHFYPTHSREMLVLSMGETLDIELYVRRLPQFEQDPFKAQIDIYLRRFVG